MQRDATASRTFSPARSRRFSPAAAVAAPAPRHRNIARPTAEPDVERPTLFATIGQCLMQLREDEPAGGDASPLFWR